MLEARKVKIGDDNFFLFGCEICHICQRKVITIKAKLTKALELKVTFI